MLAIDEPNEFASDAEREETFAIYRELGMTTNPFRNVHYYYLYSTRNTWNAVLQNKDSKKIRYKINRRPSQSKNNSNRSKAQIKRREREKSSVRAKVEHVFTVVKGRFQYRKTRYWGLLKQTTKLNMVFALANLILADRPCLAA